MRLGSRFADSGYEVECAPTARKAIAAFQSTSPELVISDFELGRYEGLELIPSLRMATGIEEIPVVVVDDRPRGRAVWLTVDRGNTTLDCALVSADDEERVRCVPEAFAADAAERYFDAALVTDDAAVLHALGGRRAG